jgi:hypothetical protein
MKISKNQAYALSLQVQSEVVTLLGANRWERLRYLNTLPKAREAKLEQERAELAKELGLETFVEWGDAHIDYHVSEPPTEPEGIVETLSAMAQANDAALTLLSLLLDARVKRRFLS